MTAFTHAADGTSAGRWREHPSWATLDPWSPASDLTTVVVVAAHPDDESLGAGGLLASAHARGLTTHVVMLTAGEASHPHSTTHTTDRLRDIRAAEASVAVRLLAPSVRLDLVGLPDGEVSQHEDTVVRRLVDLVGDGRRTLLVAPWRGDGHPDHEAAGRAAAVAATRTGATYLEYPIWFWHWAEPQDAPWSDLCALDLDEHERGLKEAAIRSHRSQVEPLSEQPGDEVLLSPGLLEHFVGPREVFLRQASSDSTLDVLHRDAAEPWGADERWYEERKRNLLLAALPRRHFERALEVGCSTGVLAADLLPRCRELVAVDSSPRAVEVAAARLANLPRRDDEVRHVQVEELEVPFAWPADRFDLVVVSELGYFLSPRALDLLVERVRTSLTEDGVLVLCHWRHDVVGWPLDGPAVHAWFRAAAVRPEIASYRDRDVEIVVLGSELPDPAR